MSRRNKCIDVSCLITSYESIIKSLEGSINVFQKRLNIEAQINNLVFDDSYKNVDIQKSMAERYSRSAVRPENMYQLIASADNLICNNVLRVLNQPGTYQGDDQVYWWVSNNSLAKWNVIREGNSDNSSKSYSHSKIEEFIGDIDGDLLPEFTYRIQGNFSSNDYQSIAIFESSLNKSSVVSEKSNVCQRLDKAECNDIKKPPLDELYKTIWEMVSAPYSSIDGKWKSAINGGKGIFFLPQYFSHLNESSKYYSSWWSNLINVEGKYGLILYPPGMDQFRVIFGVPSKDDIVQYQCVFAPKIIQN